MFKRVRYYIFLKDVLLLALSSFGGPQAHIAHFLRVLVIKRAYLSEADLIELNALCNILPGPTSTQTITAVGFRIGGPKLAFLTLLVWMLPAVAIMTTAGIIMSNIHEKDLSIAFTKFIQPMAVGFVAYAAYMISMRTVNTRTGVWLMIFAGVVSYFVRTPFVFPVILLLAGLTTALKYKTQPKEKKSRLEVQWGNFILWAGVLLAAAALGAITKALPI
ncbi:MAG TPA: chromate transporter, partial [Cyclobacteriaceae bacterium]|nr:chromate transporter [Cyclobacteriaceae bacterium]